MPTKLNLLACMLVLALVNFVNTEASNQQVKSQAAANTLDDDELDGMDDLDGADYAYDEAEQSQTADKSRRIVKKSIEGWGYALIRRRCSERRRRSALYEATSFRRRRCKCCRRRGSR